MSDNWLIWASMALAALIAAVAIAVTQIGIGALVSKKAPFTAIWFTSYRGLFARQVALFVLFIGSAVFIFFLAADETSVGNRVFLMIFALIPIAVAVWTSLEMRRALRLSQAERQRLGGN